MPVCHRKNATASRKPWIKNEIRVIVCTNAFGMGIDKPDVRTVVHADVPDCLENYYQEAGRAGRDRQRAYAVLLYDQGCPA
jgi:ATP-dependent DNA helicase RecQ